MTKKEFMKLKVGDKVRIVSEVPMMVGNMEKHLGTIMTVKEWDKSFGDDVVRMVEDSDCYVWDAKMIKEKVEHYRVLCTKCLNKYGYAKDIFTVGKVYEVVNGKITMDKSIFGETELTFVDDIRPVNFEFEKVDEDSIVRAKCVSDLTGGELFTVGKIYEKINGKVYRNDGFVFTGGVMSDDPTKWDIAFTKFVDADKPVVPVCHELRDAVIDSVKDYVDDRIDKAILKHEEVKHKKDETDDILPTQDFIGGLVYVDGRRVKEVKRAAKVGDWIKIIDAYLTGGKYTNGDILKVVSLSLINPGDVRVIVENGMEWCIYQSEYVVLEGYKSEEMDNSIFRMSMAEIRRMFGLVTETKRLANVGEWIKITDKRAYEERYENGDIFKVEKVRESDDVVYVNTTKKTDVAVAPDEYVVLENYKPKKKHNDGLDAKVYIFDELTREDKIEPVNVDIKGSGSFEFTVSCDDSLVKKFEEAILKSSKPEVKEVHRKAKRGDYIKIVNVIDYRYVNGNIFKVKGISENDCVQIVIDDDIVPVYHQEYVVLENYNPEK